MAFTNKTRRFMQLQLRKLGDSTGLLLPPSLMRDLGLAAGQWTTLRKMANGAILLTPKVGKRRYSAAELNTQCNRKAAMPDDLMAWEHMLPAGSEAL